MASAVTGAAGVETVVNEMTILDKFYRLLDGARNAVVIIALILIVAAALLVANTIRLSAFNRRRETAIMRLVGASNFYIQLPFLLEGTIAGLIGWAIAADLGFGVLFWLLGVRAIPRTGALATVWLIRVSGTLFTCAILQVQKTPLRMGNAKTAAQTAAMGLLDTGAFVLSNVGMQLEQVAIVSVLGSLYGAVTVALAAVLLRERIGPREAANRFDQIAVGLGVAGDGAAERRNHVEGVEIVERVEAGHVDRGELQAEELAAEAQHAKGFGERRLDARHIADAECDGDGVAAARGKRQRLGIALDEDDGIVDAALGGARAADRKHIGIDVEHGDMCALAAKSGRDGLADAGRCASDDSNVIVQKARHRLSPYALCVSHSVFRSVAPRSQIYGCFFISAQEAMREAPPAATYM